MENRKNQVQVVDHQNNNIVIWVDEKRAFTFCTSYKSRFSYYQPEEEITEMPKIPTPPAQLEDGSYLFKIKSCVTNAGKYGPQEELFLTVLDDKGDETPGHLKFWIGHDSVKAFEMCKKGGILLVDTESQEWQVKTNCIFNGVMQNGKLILITRA